MRPRYFALKIMPSEPKFHFDLRDFHVLSNRSAGQNGPFYFPEVFPPDSDYLLRTNRGS
jgi:hypothetical protein